MIYICLFVVCLFVVVVVSDDDIRECVFLSLDQRFDPHLAQAESLTTLFVAMHDGVSERREGGREGGGGGECSQHIMFI